MREDEAAVERTDRTKPDVIFPEILRWPSSGSAVNAFVGAGSHRIRNRPIVSSS